MEGDHSQAIWRNGRDHVPQIGFNGGMNESQLVCKKDRSIKQMLVGDMTLIDGKRTRAYRERCDYLSII